MFNTTLDNFFPKRFTFNKPLKNVANNICMYIYIYIYIYMMNMHKALILDITTKLSGGKGQVLHGGQSRAS
jgi:hypothetical protein